VERRNGKNFRVNVVVPGGYPVMPYLELADIDFTNEILSVCKNCKSFLGVWQFLRTKEQEFDLISI
jgi:hypothetical protein